MCTMLIGLMNKVKKEKDFRTKETEFHKLITGKAEVQKEEMLFTIFRNKKCGML